MSERREEQQRKKTRRFLTEFSRLSPEEERINRELINAQKEYCDELRKTIKFITEEFAIHAKEEEQDAVKYKTVAKSMSKFPTAERIFLELSDAESEHARKLRAVGGKLISDLEVKLRMYKWTTSSI